MPFFSYLDEKSDITDIILRDVKRFKPLGAFTEDILRGRSEFSVQERETMGAFVSGLNECTYCYNSHVAVAVEFGVDAKLLENLLEDIATAPIPEKLKPVFLYIRKLTLTPSKMVRADADKVLEAGWSEQALTDAICICGLFNLYNRLLDGHGVKGDATRYEQGAAHLSKRGYKTNWIGKLVYWLRK